MYHCNSGQRQFSSHWVGVNQERENVLERIYIVGSWPSFGAVILIGVILISITVEQLTKGEIK